MGRPIKFRVWHEESKTWKITDLCLHFINKIAEFWLSDGYTIEQYTGLKDKNGKEIYENDIVKITRSYGYGFLPKGAKAKIVFDEKELCYKLQGQGEFRLTSKKEVEIIGNAHENPELLGGRK